VGGGKGESWSAATRDRESAGNVCLASLAAAAWDAADSLLILSGIDSYAR
jgi:hypothetical protein